MTEVATSAEVGVLLRGWRRRRRLSQLELSCETGVSTRHLSFVETGRARPSRDMVLHLAETLEVPLRARNDLLLAAGFAPAFRERGLADPQLTSVRGAVELVLTGMEPYPAIAVDRGWNLLAGNRAVSVLTAGIAPELLEPPVNVLRLALHPAGLAARILNLAQWRSHLLHRLAREAAITADPALAALHAELAALPSGGNSSVLDATPDNSPADSSPPDDIAVPLRLRHVGTDRRTGAREVTELNLLSTVTTFGTAVDITAAELSIEAFLPADPRTAAALRALVA